ncbi:hypothetical protein [Pontibacter pamirensis]|uniref:hypothetical protein n=1 Tax=Pontibacter pamirensis TaxID=2562824 RepID=UPI00138A380E|nr:hypothetical protein [Pontibacter pamirensis]
MKWHNNIIYNCKKATFLIDKKNLEGISPLQRIELRLHLAGCSVCRLYYSQSRRIDQMLRGFYPTRIKPENGLDEAFKKGLQENIAKEIKKSGA